MNDQTESARTTHVRAPSRGTRLYDHGREISREARTITAAAEEAAEEIGGFLREQMERRPYTTLATAAGVGYVLGGGLASRLTRLALVTGTRLAMAMVAREFGVLLESTDRAARATNANAGNPNNTNKERPS